jgi:hypothetical protein
MCHDRAMERRYWEPPDSIKLLMIILAVPVIAVCGLVYAAGLFAWLGLVGLGRLVLGRRGDRR